MPEVENERHTPVAAHDDTILKAVLEDAVLKTLASELSKAMLEATATLMPYAVQELPMEVGTALTGFLPKSVYKAMANQLPPTLSAVVLKVVNEAVDQCVSAVLSKVMGDDRRKN